MKVLYIADLGEDIEASRKDDDSLYGQLRKSCASKDIELAVASDDLSTEDPAHVLAKCLLNGTPDLIVGKGFAGVFALLIGRATKKRTILVNPMYPIFRYLPYVIPDYGFKNLLESFEFDKLCWDDRRQTLDNVFVILSEDDDVVDTKRTDKYFKHGNSIYVSGGHDPRGDDFKAVFKELVSHVSDDADEIREKLDLYKKEGIFDRAHLPNLPKETGADDVKDETVDDDFDEINLSENGRLVMDMKVVRIDNDEDAEDPDFNSDAITVDSVKTENGNLAIKWHLNQESDKERFLYLYYKDGKWYRDCEDGKELRKSVLVAVLQKAAKMFLDQTEMTEHTCQDFWGWVW